MAGRVSADLRGLATELETITSRALEWTARDAKAAFQAVASAATGGDSRLSGVGTKGAKLSNRYDFQKGSRGLEVTLRAVGPWQFVEYPRRGGYRIPKRKGRGANRSRRGPVRMHLGAGNATGDWTSGAVHGGGVSRGAGPWMRALPRVLEAASDGMADAVAKVLERW